MPLIKNTELVKPIAKEWLANGLNGTKAVQKIRPYKTYKGANVEAVRLFKTDAMKQAIADILEEQGLSDEYVVNKLKRNINQTKNYSASNTGIETVLKLKGHLKDSGSTHNTLSIHATPDNIDVIITQTLALLQGLKGSDTPTTPSE